MLSWLCSRSAECCFGQPTAITAPFAWFTVSLNHIRLSCLGVMSCSGRTNRQASLLFSTCEFERRYVTGSVEKAADLRHFRCVSFLVRHHPRLLPLAQRLLDWEMEVRLRGPRVAAAEPSPSQTAIAAFLHSLHCALRTVEKGLRLASPRCFAHMVHRKQCICMPLKTKSGPACAFSDRHALTVDRYRALIVGRTFVRSGPSSGVELEDQLRIIVQTFSQPKAHLLPLALTI